MITRDSFTTSTKIAIRFSVYVSILLFVLGTVINMVFAIRWYTHETRLFQGDMQGGSIQSPMLRNQPKPPKPLPRKRFFNPMSASIKLDRTDESLQIISDNVFLIKDIVCQNDVCFMFRVNDTTIFLRDITLHMRMQSNLFVSTIIIIILSALSAFFIGRIFVAQSFRPLRLLAKNVKTISVDNYTNRLYPRGSKDDEIYLITQALKGSFDTIKSQVDALRQFVAYASHEFKTPLSTISALIDLGQTQTDRTLSDQKIKKSLHHMNSLLESLVSLARMESQIVHTKHINIYQLVQECIDNLMDKDRVSINYNGIEDYVISTDETMATMIVQNILTNACKFSPVGSTITVTLTKQSLIVIDQGPGISAEDMQNIRQRFRKKDSSTSGYGLGLYLVRILVEKLGWTIDLKSVNQKGTTCTIIFS